MKCIRREYLPQTQRECIWHEQESVATSLHSSADDLRRSRPYWRWHPELSHEEIRWNRTDGLILSKPLRELRRDVLENDSAASLSNWPAELYFPAETREPMTILLIANNDPRGTRGSVLHPRRPDGEVWSDRSYTNAQSCFIAASLLHGRLRASCIRPRALWTQLSNWSIVRSPLWQRMLISLRVFKKYYPSRSFVVLFLLRASGLFTRGSHRIFE